jgi:phenylalanine-4-hydroxylase
MFNKARLHSPVTTSTGGDVMVHLSDEHPGVQDPEYRARRNAIAALALSYRPGQPVPHIDYTDEEQQVWRIVAAELSRKHRRYAATEVLAGEERLALPADHILQLDEVSAKLMPLSGFRYVPAAGLVPLRDFLGSFSDRIFHSTQYIRHHSAPLYTPEPDAIHEILGHANQLASPRFAAIYAEAGRAVGRLETDAALHFLANVFWFSIEFGVVRELGEVRCYGAGLLSSYGEIEKFRHAELRPLNVHDMGNTSYDITHYQPVLYCARSVSEIEDVVGGFFATMTDDVVERLQAASGPAAR